MRASQAILPITGEMFGSGSRVLPKPNQQDTGTNVVRKYKEKKVVIKLWNGGGGANHDFTNAVYWDQGNVRLSKEFCVHLGTCFHT